MFARTEQIADAENQVLGFERLDDILLSPGGQGFADRLLILLDAVDDDRDEIGAGILLHPAGELDAVHHGHHQVADDHVGFQFLRQRQPRPAVGSHGYPEMLFQAALDVSAHVGIVFDDQHQIFPPISPGFRRLLSGPGLRRFTELGNLFVRITAAVDGKANRENGALALLAADRDLARMEFDQRL